MKIRDNECSSVLDKDAMTMIQDCVCAGLPSHCSPKEVVHRTLDFVFKIDALARDPMAMRFFFNSVISCRFPTSSTPLQGAVCAQTVREMLTPLWQEMFAPAPAEEQLPTLDRTSRGKSPTAAKEDPNVLLSPRQLAERWGVSKMTLWRWRHEGKLRCHHMGRGVRFKMRDVLEFERTSRS